MTAKWTPPRRKRGTGGLTYSDPDEAWRMTAVKPASKLNASERRELLFPGKNTKKDYARAERALARFVDSLKREAYNEDHGAASADPFGGRAMRKMSLDDFARRHWEPMLDRGGHRAKVADEYKIAYRKRISPVLGSRRLDSIRPADASALDDHLVAEGYALATRRRTITILKGILKLAVAEHGIIRPEHETNMHLPKARRAEPKLADLEPPKATPEQTAAVIRAALSQLPSPTAAALLLAARLGLRKSEALGVQWSDIDFDAGTLTVRRGVTETPSGELVIDDPKTANSKRTIAVPPDLLDTLSIVREQRVAAREEDREKGRFLEYVNDDPVWLAEAVRRKDQPTRPTEAQRKSMPILRGAGLNEGGWHALRHGWIAAAKARGVNPYKVAAYVGDDPVTVLTFYGKDGNGEVVEVADVYVPVSPAGQAVR